MSKEDNTYDFDLFDQVIKQELNENDIRNFEKSLEANQDMNEAFKLHKDATIAIQSLGKDQLRSKIAEITQQDNGQKINEKTNVVSLFHFNNLLKIAAVGILLVGSFFFIQNNNNININSQNTFASVYQLEIDKLQRMGFAKSDEKVLMHDFITNVKNQNKDEAEEELSALQSKISAQSFERVQLYNILLQLNKNKIFDENDLLYNIIIKHKSNNELHQVLYNWNNLLLKKDVKNSRSFFEKLAGNQNSEYRTIAKTLLN